MFSTEHVALEALGVPSPFFPGILLSRKPPLKPRENGRSLERTMVEKNGKSTPREAGTSCARHLGWVAPYLCSSFGFKQGMVLPVRVWWRNLSNFRSVKSQTNYMLAGSVVGNPPKWQPASLWCSPKTSKRDMSRAYANGKLGAHT